MCIRDSVYAALGDALDRAEGNVAEEAAYYEKALEIVPNLYIDYGIYPQNISFTGGINVTF